MSAIPGAYSTYRENSTLASAYKDETLLDDEVFTKFSPRYSVLAHYFISTNSVLAQL